MGGRLGQLLTHLWFLNRVQCQVLVQDLSKGGSVTNKATLSSLTYILYRFSSRKVSAKVTDISVIDWSKPSFNLQHFSVLWGLYVWRCLLMSLKITTGFCSALRCCSAEYSTTGFPSVTFCWQEYTLFLDLEQINEFYKKNYVTFILLYLWTKYDPQISGS